MGAPGVAAQKQVIDAAVEAGVKRFIPSEFGSDLDNPKSAGLAVFAGKVVVRKQLEQLAAQGRITWSAITPGAFLDWGLFLPILQKGTCWDVVTDACRYV